jgi:hypothetical protein
MADTPISKSQVRALIVLGLYASSDYNSAASALENAGFPADGVPCGHTWRTAKKLNDDQLRQVLNASRSANDVDYETEIDRY